LRNLAPANFFRITPDGRKLEVLADSYDGYRFTTVKDLAIGGGHDLFVSSPFSGTIYRIRPQEGFIGILNDDLVRVEGISVSPDGKRLVAAEPDASRVVVFDIPEELIPVESWTLVDFSPTGVEPRGLAFDEKGWLYVGTWAKPGKFECLIWKKESKSMCLTQETMQMF
jgi:sugar lactone lactonase YvrE